MRVPTSSLRATLALLLTASGTVAAPSGWMPSNATPPLLRSAPQADQNPASESLQEFLRRLRKRRQERDVVLRESVQIHVGELEALGSSANRRENQRLRGALLSLGPEAAPLFLPYADPGSPPTTATLYRASVITDVLTNTATRAITEPLIHMASSSSKLGRMNAIRVLGYSPDQDRAAAALGGIFQLATGKLRSAALDALVQLGGDESVAILRSALDDPDPQVVGTVLSALAGNPTPDSASPVRTLLADTKKARSIVAPIVVFFEALGDSVTQEDCQALAALATADLVSQADRVLLLATLPSFEPSIKGPLKSSLESLLEFPSEKVSEEAQICLALLGDRSVRRSLIKRYDTLVDDNARWPNSYEQRAAMYLRIGEYADSIKDYKRSIELRTAMNRTVDSDLRIELARASVLGGRLRQAQAVLEDARLTPTRRRQLADDPDFADLVKHSKYGKVLR